MLKLFQEKTLQAIYFIFGEIDFSVFDSTQVTIDILLVAALIYLVLRSIERIHASQVITSTMILAFLVYLSQSFNLIASKIVLQGIFVLLLVSIPFMFQQEIRHLFERLGKSPFIFFKKENISTKHRIIKAIKHSCQILSEKKHGALIVVEKSSSLQIYAETGILLNAKISKELLLNIFYPKSPLHDGAVIIRNNKIISAGAVLPFTHSTSEYMYGTRHKSALGLSEITDAIVVVISEERGEISIAREGVFRSNITPLQLEEYLQKEI